MIKLPFHLGIEKYMVAKTVLLSIGIPCQFVIQAILINLIPLVLAQIVLVTFELQA